MALDTGSVTGFASLYRTTAFKLALVYLAVFALFAAVLIAYFVINTGHLLSRQYADATAEEIVAFQRVYQRSGMRRLVRFVDARSRLPGAGIYLLTDSSGRFLAGNIGEISSDAFDSRRLRQFPYRSISSVENTESGAGFDDKPRPSLVRGVRLPSGFNLIVGRDLRDGERYRLVVRRAVMTSVGFLFVLAAVSLFFISRRVVNRMDSVSETSQFIIDGDLTQRVPVTGTGDEFDRLASGLNRMLDRIENLMTGLKEVSDNVAHDLKTPLTRTRNRVEAALRQKDLSTVEAKEVLEETLADCDGLIETFNALLSIARAEAGEGARFEQFDLAHLVRDMAELYEPLIEDAGATLSVDAPTELKIDGNRQLLGQALANLLDNAMKYGLEGDAPKIAIRLRSHKNEISLSVLDSGVGILEADRDRVTGRFVRLDKSRTEPGSGLGLSLVNAVATLHKGHLKLDDGLGEREGRASKGLSVTLRLPHRHEEAAET